jgi:multidrug efflux pump subunit AcrB
VSVTRAALSRPRFTVVAAFAVLLAGLALLPGFPSTEEPTVPVRVATVVAQLPGASSERVEDLVARPIEERLREIDRVEHLDTVVRPGAAFIYVSLEESTPPGELASAWQRVRAKVQDAAAVLPPGTVGPFVDDEFGRVAVRSVALYGDGYSAGQLQDAARRLRDRLQGVPGAERVSLHGVREERVYVELSPARLAEYGLDAATVGRALEARNLVAPSGELIAGGRVLALDPLADLRDAAALATTPIARPDGSLVSLGALGTVVQAPADPPATAAFYDGRPAIVLGVSMKGRLDVQTFAAALDAELESARAELPAGMQLGTVTDQAAVVRGEITRVGQVFVETIVIVMAVVVLFIGWRAGLVTGAIVPLTVLGTLVAMRVLEIELHQVSIGAIIISLGLFVDNAIVVVEDYQRRVAAGEPKRAAAEAAGRTTATPLLVSSLAIILAFVPLVAGETDTAEYMRSLAIVLAITLLLSLFVALTVMPVLSVAYAGDAAHDADDGRMARVRRWYADHVRAALRRPKTVVAAMVALLAASIAAFSLLPTELLSSSARRQLQVPIELAPGTSSTETQALAQSLSRRLAGPEWSDRLSGNAVYVGDGGPRFILGLNPPTPAPHIAYAVVNLADGADLDATVDALRTDLQQAFPQARIEPKRFSLGVAEAGTAVFRLVGTDRAALDAAAVRLKTALSAIPGVVDVRDDGEARVERLAIDVDPLRAAEAGVTVADVAATLQAIHAGVEVTKLRQGDVLVPVVVRSPADERVDPARLAAQRIAGAGGTVALGEIADVRIADQPSVLVRRNARAALTVTARHPELTAQQIVDRVAPALDALGLPDGHAVEIAGEIEESAEANAGLERYFPFALLGMAGLFLWQFGSLRKAGIVLASIPFVMIGATLGLLVTGQAVSYTATLGLLALAGIIVNNAVLLLERTAEEEAQGKPLLDAVVDAAAVRFRPILMTKLTCVAGLVPLLLFGGELWRPLAATMIGGLSLGTLVTLLLIPALYVVLFRGRAPAPIDPARANVAPPPGDPAPTNAAPSPVTRA